MLGKCRWEECWEKKGLESLVLKRDCSTTCAAETSGYLVSSSARIYPPIEGITQDSVTGLNFYPNQVIVETKVVELDRVANIFQILVTRGNLDFRITLDTGTNIRYESKFN